MGKDMAGSGRRLFQYTIPAHSLNGPRSAMKTSARTVGLQTEIRKWDHPQAKHVPYQQSRDVRILYRNRHHGIVARGFGFVSRLRGWVR
jgi:hypothetical protein